MQEIDIHHDNAFQINEIRIISDQPTDAIEVPTVFVGPGKYLGCYKDKAKRDLPHLMASCNDMTPWTCNTLCLEAGFGVYGLQWYGECRCGPKGWKANYGKKEDKDCNTPCKGDVSIMCGGGWLNSVHEVSGIPQLYMYMSLIFGT